MIDKKLTWTQIKEAYPNEWVVLSAPLGETVVDITPTRASQFEFTCGMKRMRGRLDVRGIMEWQAVAGLWDGALLVERPEARPNPIVEVRQSLADGTEIKAVWSHLSQSEAAKLVTVHFIDVE